MIYLVLFNLIAHQLSFGGQAYDCVCPYDESIVVNPGNQSCGQIECPACGRKLFRAIYVDGNGNSKINVPSQNKTQIEATPAAGMMHTNPGMIGMHHTPIHHNNTVATQPIVTQPVIAQPDTNAQNTQETLQEAAPNTQPSPQTEITYTNTISGIVEVSCSRCHSGPLRNLMSYENIKKYADSGLLKMMVQPGGPMNRFALKNADTIIKWTEAGAPK